MGAVISVKSSFFDIGGDSLKAGQLVASMRRKLRIQLSVSDLFTASTIGTRRCVSVGGMEDGG